MTHSSARKGDLVAVETTRRTWVTGQPAEERTTVELARVASATRDGIVKTYQSLAYANNSAVKVAGNERCYVMPAARVDFAAVTAAVLAHTWPQHPSPMPFGSLAEARDAIRHAVAAV